jgi:transcriptional regulator with XRE-family HTH domain
MEQGRGDREVGRHLRSARQQRGLTQHELAQRSGLRLDTLRSIEQGRTPNPGVYTVLDLAEALEMTVDELLTASDRGARSEARATKATSPDVG